MKVNCKVNRKIREKHVSLISELIKNGHWDLNGVPLIFDSKSNLIDGQHRCLAVIKCGIPVATFCVQGVREDSKFSIDHYTMKKQLKDILQGKGESHSAHLATSINYLMKYKQGKEGSKNTDATLKDNRLLLKLFEKHNHLREMVAEAYSIYGRSITKPIGPGYMAYLIYVLNCINDDYAKEFISILMGLGGEGGKIENTGPYQCQRRLIRIRKERLTSLKLSVIQKEGMVILAWNAFIQGISCDTSRYLIVRPGHSYPKIKDEEGNKVEYKNINWKELKQAIK